MKILIILASLSVVVSGIRIAIFSDVHLNTTYDYTCGFSFCYDQGTYDLDSPPALFSTMLDDLQSNYNSYGKTIDAILVQGDMIVHGLSTSDPSSNNWPQQKAVLQELIAQLQKRFPNTPVIFGIGNNDVLQHYEAPVPHDKAMFYGDLFTEWFTNIPANAAQPNILGN